MTKRPTSRFLNTAGFGLIDVMMTAGISMLVSLGSLGLLQQQQTQLVRMETKSAVLESQYSIVDTLADAAICTPQFAALGSLDLSGITTSPSTPASPISLSQIYLGSTSSSAKGAQTGVLLPGLSVGPQVDKIYVSDIARKTAADDKNYTAAIYVTFKEDKRFKPDLQPMRIGLDFTTNAAPITSRTITNCQTFATTPTLVATAPAAPAPAVSCPGNQFLKGVSDTGSPICTPPTLSGAPCGPGLRGIVLYFVGNGAPYCCALDHWVTVDGTTTPRCSDL